MKIIGLYGHSNCGKTQTLNFLREMLRQNGESLSKNAPHQGDTPETFLYHGLIVCVAPGGDNEDVVRANVRYFKSKNCDVAITATRCKGGSVRPYMTMSKKWVLKSCGSQSHTSTTFRRRLKNYVIGKLQNS